MAGNLIDISSLRNLLLEAIGDRQKNDFAKEAGISPYSLSRMLNNDNISTPRKETLHLIAAASQGRVSEAKLFAACGYDVSLASRETIEKETAADKGQQLSIAMDLKKGVTDFFGNATKYNSIEDALDTVNLLYGTGTTFYRVGKEEEFKGKGRKGADFLSHCSLYWKYKGYDGRLYFTVFYCKTTSGGYILSDCAFDLNSLLEVNNPAAGAFLFNIAEKGDVDRSEYDVVFICKKHVAGEAERRLLKAIFGEDYDKEDPEHKDPERTGD